MWCPPERHRTAGAAGMGEDQFQRAGALIAFKAICRAIGHHHHHDGKKTRSNDRGETALSVTAALHLAVAVVARDAEPLVHQGPAAIAAVYQAPATWTDRCKAFSYRLER